MNQIYDREQILNHIMFQFYPIKTMAVLVVIGVSGSEKSTIGKELGDVLTLILQKFEKDR